MSWRTNPEIVVQRLGDEVVLVNLATDRILELNETAARLFELLSDGKDEEQIAAQLEAEYEVERGALSTEIGAMLKLLAKEQVVTADAA